MWPDDAVCSALMGSAAVATYKDDRMDFPISVLMAAQPRHPGKLIRKGLSPSNLRHHAGLVQEHAKQGARRGRLAAFGAKHEEAMHFRLGAA